jgi:hypothetical protein
MAFKIEFTGFHGGDGLDLEGNYTAEPYAGYMPWDYLPDFDEQEFETLEEARAFIAANHRGEDRYGINARFVIVED